MPDKIIVERIEENFAVCEIDGEYADIELKSLPSGIKEGDVLIKADGVWIIDTDEAARLRKQNSDKFKKLFSKE